MCFKQNFKGSVGRPMADRQEKNIISCQIKGEKDVGSFLSEIFHISVWTFYLVVFFIFL